MFKIYDGREHFYQWDSDRKLIVEDPAIKEVHFCNRTDDCSLVCETYTEDGLTLANVPNILLQTDWRIKVYAFDGNYTKYEECYEVKPRTKPADYVYTETEVLNFNTLLERVVNVEETVDGLYEDMGEAIGDYIREHPIEVDLSDYYTKREADKKFALKEEVPSIAGLATEQFVEDKISAIPETDLTNYYTKSEVDKAIEDIDIPDADLSNYYTKAETDAAIEGVEVDLSNYYTKAEVDAELENVDVDLTDYYTKTEINDLLANLPTGDIPSGEEVKF